MKTKKDIYWTTETDNVIIEYNEHHKQSNRFKIK